MWWYRRHLATTAGAHREVYTFDHKKYGWYMIPAHFFDPARTATVELGQGRYPIPWRSDILLELFYGPNWRVPVPKDHDGDPNSKKGAEDFSNFIEVVDVAGGRQEFRVKEAVWRLLDDAANDATAR